MFSSTYKWTLRRVKLRHSLILQGTRGGDEHSAQDCRIMFPSEGAAVQHGPDAVLIIQALPMIQPMHEREVKAAAGG